MSERCRLLGKDENCDDNIDAEKRYDGKIYERRSARNALMMAFLLILPALFLLGRPYPRLAPSIWNPQLHNPQQQSTHVTVLDIPHPDHSKYLVWNPQCRIPDINPHSKEAMELFRKKNYVSCSTGPEYVYLEKDENNQSVLHINKTAFEVSSMKKINVSCCYINITRSDVKPKITKSSCLLINDSTVLSDTEEFIMTMCTATSKPHKDIHSESHKVHKDVFLNVRPTQEVQKRLDHFKNIYKYQHYWNVLIIGVDTLSRINLARAMPKTHAYFKSNHWLDFQGYNKIDDNTFPNLMALLTGRNSTRARELCDGEGKHSLDHCDFMWKTYQNAGFVSMYAEDDIGIDTFEKPYHKGFNHKPTDHYIRPLFQVGEKCLKSVFCTGQKTSGEVLFQYTLNFVETYKNDPYFAFIWANTFSHDNVATPSTMDEKLAEFLRELKSPEKTFMIFISDHGIRYGNMRSTFSGFYEERLPAFYMYIPEKFKEMHKNAHLNLITNTKRLTTPYDVFMTLQDVLFLSGRKDVLVSSEACPMCQSLFQAVPWNRSCEDSAITPHWCTCTPLKALPVNHRESSLAAHYVVDQVIEKLLRETNTKKCRRCSKLSLYKVISKYEYENIDSNMQNTTDYLVVFSTIPGHMIFEASVRHDSQNNQFSSVGMISRLSEYKGTGYCVHTAYLKKYCFCNKKCK